MSFNEKNKTSDNKDKKINEKDIIKSKSSKDEIKEESKKKNESSVKYEYQEPSVDLKKIIPYCNNFFIIQEND